MKKLWTELEGIHANEIRSADEVKRKRVSARKRRLKNQEKSGKPTSRTIRRKDILPQVEVAAPPVLSLVKNPDGTNLFLSRIRQVARTNHVRVKLNHVEDLGVEAIGALLAIIKHPEIDGLTRIRGDIPDNPVLREILEGSGFLGHVHRTVPEGPARGAGRMFRIIQNKEVMATVAKDLSVFAMEKLHGIPKKHGPSYSLLLETMSNTFDHASPNSLTRQEWWASVYFDENERKACFTFIDQGVGILHSFTFLQRLKRLRREIRGSGEKLRDLLMGKIPSRTREKHRGRGLPKAYETWKSGRLDNLVVIANDGYANAQKQEFKDLAVPFNGTIVYWEVSQR